MTREAASRQGFCLGEAHPEYGSFRHTGSFVGRHGRASGRLEQAQASEHFDKALF